MILWIIKLKPIKKNWILYINKLLIINIQIMDYITKDDTIIFSPEFNKELNSELLKNYKKIIFND